MIEVSGVFHHYGIRPVLDDVSFSVQAGQTLAVIGPNGSGKTTLLNLLGGVASPSEGTVKINGMIRRGSVEDELTIRQQAVFLPDECWLPDTTGRLFLLGTGEVYGVPDRQLFEHVDQLLKVFRLEPLGDAAMSCYSTGQKKKIALCSALVSEASIVFLDEPFSGGLDPAGITAMKQILKHLTAREDRTVVLTSPVPELVEEVADAVLILSEGRVLRCDSIANLKAESNTTTLDDALRQLIFPETQADLDAYFNREVLA